MDNAIELQNVSRIFSNKSQKNKVALDRVSFKVEKGTIHGLIGPNGAGKSTTMKILSTLLLPTSGIVKINGTKLTENLQKIRQDINFVYGGERDLYWRLSGRDNLQYFAALYNVASDKRDAKISHLLKIVGLEEAKDNLVETYSKGMRQRLQIARSLLNDPKILLLDEPTVGLDQENSEKFKKIVQDLINSGKSILFTSHYLEEIEDLCNTITILNHGKVVATGTPTQLRQVFQNDIQFKIVCEGKYEKIANILPSILCQNTYQTRIEYRMQSKLTEIVGILKNNKKVDIPQTLYNFLQSNPKIRKYQISTPSLDYVYKYYTS